ALRSPLTVIVGLDVLLSVKVKPAAVDAAMDTATALSVMLTSPAEVVAIVGAFVPFVLSVMLPVPLLSCRVPEVKTDPADWLMVPVPLPLAVKVTEEAPPPEPMLAASAMLPLEAAPVF